MPNNLDLDGRLTVVNPFTVERVTTGKEEVAAAELVGHDSEDSDDDEEKDQQEGADDVEMRDDAQPAQPQAANVAGPSRASRGQWLDLMEQEITEIKTSVNDLGKRVDEMATQQKKTENLIIGWLRALGRACNVDVSSVSD